MYRVQPASAGRVRRSDIVMIITRLLSQVRGWHRNRDTINHLLSLPDGRLNDIGLSRGAVISTIRGEFRDACSGHRACSAVELAARPGAGWVRPPTPRYDRSTRSEPPHMFG